ncbi:MAG: transcription antitermination factor NusB, partial [Sphingomicrobium sp.]
MTRSISRSAARLAAVQALYQQEMEGTPAARLIHEFHDHRLGATIEGDTYVEAEQSFFDDLVSGTLDRREEIDGLIAGRLAEGWTLERLDKPMKAILRVGAYELIARPDVPVASVISEYVDVADAFYDKREKGFVNGLLDAIAKA